MQPKLTCLVILGLDLVDVHLVLRRVDLRPQIPLEELFFLILLCMTAMDVFLLAQRLLTRGRLR